MSARVFEGTLSEYPDEYLECRTSGHLWQWVTDWAITTGHRGQVLEFARTRRCARGGIDQGKGCPAEVRKTYDGRTGRTLGSAGYRYPVAEGRPPYTFGKGLGVGDARLEALRRAGLIV
jgi:hypothetical protein